MGITPKNVLDRIRRWKKANREKVLEGQKKYRERNKEILKEKNKKYVEENKEKRLETTKKYRDANREKMQEYNRQYREEHKEELREYYLTSIQREEVREYRRVAVRNRRARRNYVEGKITTAEWEELKDKYGNKCLRCGRTDAKLELDHVVPLALGGKHSIENAQPLCRSCNASKHVKTKDYRHAINA
jgi:5-methylcytosine-specific restriction endonuclease McrA